MFLNVLFKSLKSDPEPCRIKVRWSSFVVEYSCEGWLMWSTGIPQAYTPDMCVSLSELCLRMLGHDVRGKCRRPAGSLALVVLPQLHVFGVSVQVLRQRPSLWSFVLQSESFDQEEHFVDVDDGNDSDSGKREVSLQDGEDVVSEGVPNFMDQSQPTYRISHREPLYSKAETSSLWELTMVCLCYSCQQVTHVCFSCRRWFTTIRRCKFLPKL